MKLPPRSILVRPPLTGRCGVVHGTLRATLLAAVLGAGVACGSDTATGVHGTPAQLRIVNSVFQYTDASSSAAKTAPRAIDVLIDSSAGTPGMASIAPNSVAAISGANGAGFAPVDPGVHGFVARLPGDTSTLATFYTNTTNNLPYLPQQYLTAGTPYTLVVAGIVPATPAPGAPRPLVPSTAAPFAIITNDPFPPPQVGGTYRARFQVINAAPFTVASGAGATLAVYLTAGATAPATVTALTDSTAVAYRGGSAYVNADPGTYVLTLATFPLTTAKIVAQAAITLAAGEVRTYVVQSTGYAAVPSPANSTIQSLLDNKY